MVKRQSDVTSEILATGEATMSQLAQMFETDAKTLPQRMKGIIPAGKRNGYKVYKIREAAGRLVKPGYEIEEFIRQMSPQELPPLLTKEFWNGQKARLAFEKERLAHAECQENGHRKAFRRITDAGIAKMSEEVSERLKDYYADREDDRGSTDVERLVDARADSAGISDSEEDEEVDI